MFSQKLKELRTRDNLSQAKFAREIGFSQSAIASWENETREPGINALIKIAQYFNTSVDYLIGFPITKRQKEKPVPLPQDEQDLLETYRKLDTQNKMHVSIYAEVRLEEQEKESNHRRTPWKRN